MIRPRQMSLRQITLHFSWVAIAPHTGQINWSVSTGSAGRGVSVGPTAREMVVVVILLIGGAYNDVRFIVAHFKHTVGMKFVALHHSVAAGCAIHESNLTTVPPAASRLGHGRCVF